jgi:HK97 family phage portal protein
MPTIFSRLLPRRRAAKSAYTENVGGLSSFANWSRYYDDAPGELKRNDHDLAVAYMTCEWAFRAVSVLAGKVADVLAEAKVYVGDNEQPDADYPHALELSYRTWKQDFYTQWARARFVWGVAYLEKVYAETTQAGRVVRRYPATYRALNPLFIEPLYQGDTVLVYQYNDGRGTMARITPDVIIEDRLYNPLDELRGYAPLAAALEAVNVDRFVKTYSINFFKNNAQLGTIFTLRQGAESPSETDWERVKTQIAERAKGVGNAFRSFILPAAFEASYPPVPDLSAYGDLTDLQKRRICAAVGVPVALVDFGDARFQLSNEQRKGFYEESVLPEARRMLRLVNADLLPFLDETGQQEVRLDLTSFKALLEDEEKRVTIVNQKLTAGIISLNEARQELDHDALPNGNFYLLPSTSIVVPAADLGKPTPPPPAASPYMAVQAPVLPTPPIGKEAGEPLFVGLHFGAHPDLVALQARLKTYYADLPVKWNDPADFHVTLLYAPSAAPEKINGFVDAVRSFGIATMALPIGSLKAFDDVGEYAIHFRIRRNTDLLELQETLYDTARDGGIALSAYSAPNAYLPHITMGYASQRPTGTTFVSKLTVAPVALVVKSGDTELLRIEISGDTAPDTVTLPDGVATRTLAPADELKTWRKYTLKQGAAKSIARFQVNVIDAHAADWIRDELFEARDDDAIKALFDDAALLFGYTAKAYEDTRAGFVGEITRLIGDAQQSEIGRQKFTGGMRSALRRYGLMAFRDGMNSEGADPESLSAEALKVFREWQAEQSVYVSNFGAEMFKEGGITEQEVFVRSQYWANRSLREIFYKGAILAAPSDKLKRWIRNPQKDSCSDCIARDGQILPYKQWVKLGLPGSESLECKGMYCGCYLEDVAPGAKSSDFEALAATLAESHNHADS